MSPISNLGTFIRQRRTELGLSARAVARKAGLASGTLDKIEHGLTTRPAPFVLHKLSRALGVDYEDLAALSGYTLPNGLPAFPVYLRTKYPDLPDEEIEKLAGYFNYVHDQHHDNPDGETDDLADTSEARHG